MKILIVSRSVFSNNPQAVRFRNLIINWKDKHQITLVTYEDNIPKNQVEYIENIIIQKVKKTWLSRKITNTMLKKKSEDNSAERNNLFRKYLRFINLRKLFFPDVYIFTIRTIKSILRQKLDIHSFDIVIISGFPFSFQKIGCFVRQKLDFSGKLVYDTGDPFFKNSSKTTQGIQHRLLSKRFEKKHLLCYNYVIVPSLALMKHYLLNFDSVFANRKIVLLPQGIHINPNHDKLSKTEEATDAVKSDSLKLIYAGSFYKKIRDPKELFRSIGLLKNTKLHVFGKINSEFFVKSNKVLFQGEISHFKLSKKYNNYDIVIFIDNSRGIQVPGKIYEILAAKRPVLFIYENIQSPTIKVIADLNVDFVFLVENNYKKIISCIEKIKKTKNKLNYNFNSKKFSWEYLSKEYLIELN